MTMKKLHIPRDLLGDSEPPESETASSVPELPEPDLGDGLGLSPEELQTYHLLSRRGSGRRKTKPKLEAIPDGPLSLSDLELLEESRVDGRQKCGAVKLSKVRSIHHQIAQYLVQGYRDIEVAALLGVSNHRIAILKNDPAFKEVLSYYSEQQKNIGISILERLQTLTVLGLEELQDRLLDEPELLTSPQIVKMLETFLDRSGFQPGGHSNKQQDAAGVSGEEVAKLKEEIARTSKTKVISRAEAGIPASGDYIPKGAEDGEGEAD